MGTIEGSSLSSCRFFQVDKFTPEANTSFISQNPDHFSIITVVSGQLQSEAGETFCPGSFFLLPRNASPLSCIENTVYLETTIPT